MSSMMSVNDESGVILDLYLLDRLTVWGYSSAGRAPALQAGGHRFDPVYLHHLCF